MSETIEIDDDAYLILKRYLHILDRLGKSISYSEAIKLMDSMILSQKTMDKIEAEINKRIQERK